MLVRSIVFPASRDLMQTMLNAAGEFTFSFSFYASTLIALFGVLSAVCMAFLLWLGLNANFEVPSPHRMLV